MLTYPKPGRGAWRILGGLLPAKPGSTSSVGYYRLAQTGEKQVGSTWADQSDPSHHAECVNLGVRAIQGLVGLSGTAVDGRFGVSTQKAVIAAQSRWAIEADGIVGPATMHAALAGLVADTSVATNVPVVILGGILAHESGLDPAAVGVNGVDHGLAQINLSAHSDEVSVQNALDPAFAIHWTGEELALVYRTWRGKTKADPWDIAIANHNSPLLAKKWATTGEAPYVEGRVFQIQEYVDAVKDSW